LDTHDPSLAAVIGAPPKVLQLLSLVTFVPDRRRHRGLDVRPSNMEAHMQRMKFFVDTHDVRDGTFPADLTKAQFAEFHPKYEEACRAEGVVNLRIHVGLKEGRAFCFNMAPDADAVRRAHARVGLPVGEITEVVTATPGDLFFDSSLM
jgi:Protein of unknown function (DUF4242)